MKLPRCLVVCLFFIFHNFYCFGQVDTLYYLYEDFEAADADISWISTPQDIYLKNWSYQYGGHDSNPIAPKHGNKNAYFYWSNLGYAPKSLLSSPFMDLSTAQKPFLSFGHAMGMSFFGTDELYLLFKAGASAPWDTIAHYNTPTGNEFDTYWYERNFNIDEIDSKYLCDDFQIGFLGIARAGHGVCIDSVVVVEKDTIDKFVRNLQTSNINYDLIPSGATDVPLYRVAIEVMGNTGSAVLHSVQITSQGTSDNDFVNGNFNLYLTRNDVFSNEVNNISTLLASGGSISSGVITFSGLSVDLPIGWNYLWLTADISATANYNNQIAFSLGVDDINIIDTLLPKTAISANLFNQIEDAEFFDDFETMKGWGLQGDFQIDVPAGLVRNGSKDPDFAFNNLKILGTDLNSDGGYIPNNITPYYVTTPLINLKYYNDVKINFQEWISIFSTDYGVIDISTDGGTNWETIWHSYIDAPSKAVKWSETTLFLDEELSHQSDVKVRFGMVNSGSFNYIGFNIDNFAVVGNHLETDLGITEILSPYDDCMGFGNDTVIVKIKNFAESASPANVPVFFGLRGIENTLVYDTIPGSIAIDDSIIFKFSIPANFQIPDYYDNFIVGIDLSSDEDPTNDTLTKPLFIKDNITPPSLVDFEYRGGIWSPSIGSTWESKEPDASIGSVPGSPKAWILSPYGDYISDDSSFVISSCYDLTSANRHVVELKYWLLSEEGHDGFSIEYSPDDGNTWYLVDTSRYGQYWGWYTQNVTALGQKGWSGNSGGWTSMHELLPASLSYEPKIKFRVRWASDSETNGRGMAFDDFEIFPAPPDVGVSSITTPYDACQGVNTSNTSVYIKNYGYNKLNANDTIIIGVDFESETPVIDSFTLGADLLPGDSVLHIVNTNFDLSVAKPYNIKAYTLIEDDPFYYLDNNDTLDYTFNIWPNPGIILADTLGSRQPDTLFITPVYPDWVPGYTYLWQDNVTTDSIFDVVSEGLHWVTATEPDHGCHTTDSVRVVLLYFDAGATEVVYPKSTCELSSSELIQIRVANVGTDSLIAGDKVALTYSVNGGTIVYDTLTVPYTLRYSMSLVHTFTDNPYDFSASGSYTIYATASYVGGDENASNDDVTDVVNAYGYTPLDLGPDLTVQALSHTLDAGPGFTEYLWNTGAATQTTLVNTSGKYWVDAVDANGCPGNDTINLWFKIRDVLADMLVSPQTGCNRLAPEEVQVRIINNGTDTITTSQNISIKYRVNNGAYITESFNPIYSILPGAQYTHEFASAVDVSAIQSYTFDVVATSSGDLRTNNDSLSVEISTNETPVVDLGEDRTIFGYQYVLDAGYGTNLTYLWQDNSTTTQTYTATVSGNYSCTVTNSTTGCYGMDTVLLIFDINDYAIQAVSVPNQVCQGNRNSVTVDVLNNGNQARTTAILNIAFKINEGNPVSEQFTISSLWMPAGIKTVTFVSPMPFTEMGTNSLKVFFDNHSDLNSGNDLLTKNVSVLESPVVDFGDDTLRVNFPYQLDAGDHESYQWQDNTTNRYLTVMNPGIYSVTVTNAANCITTQSVFIDQASFVNEAAAEKLDVRLFPNPASDMLNIEVNLKTGGEIVVEIVDITNHVIFSDTHVGYETYYHTLDVNSMPRGVYFIRFRNSDVYQVTRFVIQ